MAAGLDPNHYDGTVLEKWGDKEWLDFGIQNRKWTLSQFLHGEQGALLCTAKITETVPWYDAKLYAATQVVDEARHVEVFARYLDEKLGGGYQVNAHLRMLLDDIINDSRWDMTYLGHAGDGRGPGAGRLRLHAPDDRGAAAQAAAALRDERRGPPRRLRRAVAEGGLRRHDRRRDEGPPGVRLRGRRAHARPLHVAGGVGAPWASTPATSLPIVLRDPTRDLFQQMLFSKIVPNCKKLGLLDRNDKWLRRRFEEMGVIQFEDLEDTGEEYIKFELGADAPSPA